MKKVVLILPAFLFETIASWSFLSSPSALTNLFMISTARKNLIKLRFSDSDSSYNKIQYEIMLDNILKEIN